PEPPPQPPPPPPHPPPPNVPPPHPPPPPPIHHHQGRRRMERLPLRVAGVRAALWMIRETMTRKMKPMKMMRPGGSPCLPAFLDGGGAFPSSVDSMAARAPRIPSAYFPSRKAGASVSRRIRELTASVSRDSAP